ncbi:hypothetical protein GCM10010149_16260 [Nonomuraea roseoviolacea subsp. roseoviolacea]|uniref:hypothetical protein n=1 Tax=Nonomuraea roseoviolacea TaxID=103837 RepID=UPI0031DD65F1
MTTADDRAHGHADLPSPAPGEAAQAGADPAGGQAEVVVDPAGGQAEVVVDPAVPHEDAALLRGNPRLLALMRAGWAPEGGRRSTVLSAAARPAATALALAAVAAGLDLFLSERYTAFAVVMSSAALLIVGVLLKPRPDARAERRRAEEARVYETARRHEERYVLCDGLDGPARALMDRAHAAVASVMGSRVNAEGLLDGVRNAVMLPEQEWGIARLLAKLSELRAEHEEVLAEGVTPEVAAVAEPLGRALAGSEAAVVARVEALERYAGHVADAERAHRARGQIERLGATLPRYEELLAESGAAGPAVPELGRLAEDAGRLEQALRDSVRAARETLRPLTPDP